MSFHWVTSLLCLTIFSVPFLLMFSGVLIMLNQFPLCDVCIFRDIVFFHVSSTFMKCAFPEMLFSKVKMELKT